MQTRGEAANDEGAGLVNAVGYTLNQRVPLKPFPSNAAVPIHRNDAERALRVVGLLRKNALFACSEGATQNVAKLLSLPATCQINAVNIEH